ncbi:frataxin, mitochondrial [Sorghum bicolor]|uniref:frataxin, mitochondrial n=1 Tax=Sorghum bicolor TaxID=4558 RepID=UPI0001A87A43|nr:frataxin, mitochondrial [Sorghum bicolor]|eukprot:XP_002445916.1 frataxin, mitochondrial [Sorghum bicolor]
MASRKLLMGLTTRRRLQSRTQQLFWTTSLPEATTSRSLVVAAGTAQLSGRSPAALLFSSRTVSSTQPVTQSAGDVSGSGPSAVDHKLAMQEDEFHKLADETIHDLLEKLEEYGDSIQMDGFDIEYGNQVLTLRLGDLGTYVINKQTPNKQIWLSSPVSGPSRFDWDATTNGWIYKRTGVNLVQLLEKEIGELCGKPVELS